jgi:hypothetical protein
MSMLEDSRFSGLLDAEQRHRAEPDTFSIPRSDVRASLRPGDLVKLLFGFGGGDQPPCERMWVEVLEVGGDGYVGRLDNTPQVISDLEPGARVAFVPRHVAATYRRSGDTPRPEQFAIVSHQVRDGARPSHAARVPAPDPQFSGWVVAADGDPALPPTDLAGFGPLSHDELVSRFRSFDSIEDEPVGTSWSWDAGALEWTPRVADRS